ncbi:MAG TPA: hypothetical protein VFN35_13170 [Ktedonobacteraceae bacterium]|nr:hypothetical protein [Ktedonobacteraceae bacterium]
MEDLHILAVAIIIGSPELLVVGAFKIASREMSRGNRKGWLLMAACLVLLFLTFLTVGDLFMWHWDAAAINVLMGFRCLAGIAYSFTRGIVTGESEPSVGEQVNLLREWFTEAMQEVNRVNQETRDLVHQAMNSCRKSDSSLSR